MTSLVAWIGVDSRWPTSIYLASDSRVTWGEEPGAWDHARKLFASKNHPDILGFCGHVLFPSQILGQIIDLIDAGLLYPADTRAEHKWAMISYLMKLSFQAYPLKQTDPFSIIFCSRDHDGMLSEFRIYTLAWTEAGEWSARNDVRLPAQSGLLGLFGTGDDAVKKWYTEWAKTREGRTSRSIYSAFCDALRTGEDPHSGGAPQLVGLYRRGAAKTFGVIWNNQRFVLGLPLPDSESLQGIEWRNELFERCDPKDMQRLMDAQPHSRPPELSAR